MRNYLDVRPSPIAGQWYSADAGHLAASVDGYIESAVIPEFQGEPLAIVVPHAGHRYSGPVAGYAFSAVRGLKPDVVVVISPMHYPYLEPLLTTAHSAYATPLGEIPVDHRALEILDSYLLGDLGFGLSRVAHDSEHSLEIELPFLQQALAAPFKLIPVMVRDQNLSVARSLGKAIVGLLSKEMASSTYLLVASSDLSHFYTQEQAKELDLRILAQIEAFDPEAVIHTEEQGKGFACGRGAIAAVLFAARGLSGERVYILNYATSGDITGDFDRVVGYAAALVTRSKM